MRMEPKEKDSTRSRPPAGIIPMAWSNGRPTGMIQHISAVTFAVRDMARSIEFYRKLGFELLYGSEGAAFSSLKAGEAFVYLFASPGHEQRWRAEPFSGSVTWTAFIGDRMCRD